MKNIEDKYVSKKLISFKSIISIGICTIGYVYWILYILNHK